MYAVSAQRALCSQVIQIQPRNDVNVPTQNNSIFNVAIAIQKKCSELQISQLL